MKKTMIAALMVLSVHAQAETVQQVIQVQTEPAVAKTDGLGCLSFEDLYLAHQSPDMMQYQMNSRKCGIIDVGDRYNLVVGYARQGTVKGYIPGTNRPLHMPAYIFQDQE